MVRSIYPEERADLLQLYSYLHSVPLQQESPELDILWQEIMADPRHHILVAEEDGKIVSTCVCVIVPNLTHNLRPYALIENVVTDPAYRARGFATACLDYACTLAREAGCYKVMLMTGSKKENTLRFYERAGFHRHEKTGFVRWL